MGSQFPTPRTWLCISPSPAKKWGILGHVLGSATTTLRQWSTALLGYLPGLSDKVSDTIMACPTKKGLVSMFWSRQTQIPVNPLKKDWASQRIILVLWGREHILLERKTVSNMFQSSNMADKSDKTCTYHTIMQIRKKLRNKVSSELEGFRRPK